MSLQRTQTQSLAKLIQNEREVGGGLAMLQQAINPGGPPITHTDVLEYDRALQERQRAEWNANQERAIQQQREREQARADAVRLARERSEAENRQREQDRLRVRVDENQAPREQPPQEQPVVAAAEPEPVRERVNEKVLPQQQGLWRTRANVGNWTGAIRPHYPRIRRPFGTNPREHFLGRRYTGMYQDGFDASVVESKATPSFIPPQRKVVQDGIPTITDFIPALRSGGSEHVLFGTNHRR